jgi:hypothetical protein
VKATPQQPAISSSQTLFAELYRNNTHALLSITFFSDQTDTTREHQNTSCNATTYESKVDDIFFSVHQASTGYIIDFLP